MFETNQKYKRILFLIFKIAVFILSYFYVYKKISEVNFSSVSFSNNDFFFIFLVVIFMIINWLLEAKKWQILVADFENISLKSSIKQVFIALSIGFFTPNRVGEIPARALMLNSKNKIKGTAAATLGSFAQFTSTVIFGLIGLILMDIFFNNDKFYDIHSKLYIFLSVIFLIVILYLFFNPHSLFALFKKFRFKDKFSQKFEFLSGFDKTRMFKVLLLSAVRYLVFSFQFYLLLHFFNIHISVFEGFIAISLSFLLITAIPGFVIADIGIRGSVSIFIFSFFTSNTSGIFFSSLFLWIINIFIPATFGYFLFLGINLETLGRKI